MNTLVFTKGEFNEKESKSLNAGAVISSREDFDKYPWADVQEGGFSALDKINEELPDDFKLIISGYGGVFENMIELVGFDSLSLMLYEDPDLVREIADAIGSRLLRYYEIALEKEAVGAVIANDD